MIGSEIQQDADVGAQPVDQFELEAARLHYGNAVIGGIIGALISSKIDKLAHTSGGFLFRQDRTTQLILAGVALVLAILISPLIFLIMGLHAGKTMHMTIEESSKQGKV